MAYVAPLSVAGGLLHCFCPEYRCAFWAHDPLHFGFLGDTADGQAKLTDGMVHQEFK